jgi:hypothetical protein
MHWLSPFFYVAVKTGPSGKRIKKMIDIIEMKFFTRTVG